jgi:hypothetical protein
MDWLSIAMVGGSLLVVVVVVVVVARFGIRIGRPPYKESRVRREKGEFEPPEAPEGRYWG